jgi:hypothetical protein
MVDRLAGILPLIAGALACVAGCGGRSTFTPNGGNTGQDTGGSTSYSPSQVSAALASCDLAHGPAVSTSSQSQEGQLMVGSWAACPDDGSTRSPMFDPGIVFESGGHWIHLATDETDHLSPVAGVVSEGQWFAQNAHEAAVENAGGDGCFAGFVSFETSPRRMYVVVKPGECPGSDGSALSQWLVPLN